MLLQNLFVFHLLEGPSGWFQLRPSSEVLLRPRVREVRDATNKERHVCARRRDGEPAVSSRRPTAPLLFGFTPALN